MRPWDSGASLCGTSAASCSPEDRGGAPSRPPSPRRQSVDRQRQPRIDVVRSFLKALEAKDLDLAASYLDPPVEYQNLPLPRRPPPHGVRRVLSPVMRATAFKARFDKIAASGLGSVLTERTDAIIVSPVRIPSTQQNGRLCRRRSTRPPVLIFLDASAPCYPRVPKRSRSSRPRLVAGQAESGVQSTRRIVRCTADSV
jgi:limonene-1,2-epoxide hydrolase